MVYKILREKHYGIVKVIAYRLSGIVIVKILTRYKPEGIVILFALLYKIFKAAIRVEPAIPCFFGLRGKPVCRIC